MFQRWDGSENQRQTVDKVSPSIGIDGLCVIWDDEIRFAQPVIGLSGGGRGTGQGRVGVCVRIGGRRIGGGATPRGGGSHRGGAVLRGLGAGGAPRRRTGPRAQGEGRKKDNFGGYDLANIREEGSRRDVHVETAMDTTTTRMFRGDVFGGTHKCGMGNGDGPGGWGMAEALAGGAAGAGARGRAARGAAGAGARGWRRRLLGARGAAEGGGDTDGGSGHRDAHKG